MYYCIILLSVYTHKLRIDFKNFLLMFFLKHNDLNDKT